MFDAVAQHGDVALDTRITAPRGAADLPTGAVDLEELIAAVEVGDRLPHDPPRGVEAAEVLTSGTTSNPKGALLSHSNLLRAGVRVALHSEIGQDDRPMTIMPLFHTGGQCMGVMASPQAPRPDDEDHPIKTMGFGLCISEEERDAFEARFGVRLTCYGQTEACLNIAIAPLHAPRRWPSLGLPAFDRVVRIVDDEDIEVTQGQVGEIVVEADPGRTVLLGYVNDPEATAKTIRDGWLHTGDNGYFDTHCAVHMARFKIPTEIEFRTDLPRTSIGKIAKRELRPA